MLKGFLAVGLLQLAAHVVGFGLTVSGDNFVVQTDGGLVFTGRRV